MLKEITIRKLCFDETFNIRGYISTLLSQDEQRNYKTLGGGDATIRDIVRPIWPQISPFLPTQGNIKGFHDLMELN